MGTMKIEIHDDKPEPIYTFYSRRAYPWVAMRETLQRWRENIGFDQRWPDNVNVICQMTNGVVIYSPANVIENSTGVRIPTE